VAGRKNALDRKIKEGKEKPRPLSKKKAPPYWRESEETSKIK